MTDLDPVSPKTPSRYRRPLFQVVDSFLDPKFGGALSDWLEHNTTRLRAGGDPRGKFRFNHEIVNFEEHWPDATKLAGALLERVDEFADVLHVPEFDAQRVELNFTLYHHGAHFGWHDDSRMPDGTTVASTRRITFAYYLHTTPRMFDGGELEFADGQTVEPKDNRLVVFHPFQRHRIRPVECFARSALAGRCAIMGWVHGAPDDEWADLARRLCPR